MTAQGENLSRVYDKIAPIIVAYFDGLGVGATFHVDELRQHVQRQMPDSAPDSPGRIMRALRGERTIGYRVVNRRASLYQITNPKVESLI